MVALFNALLWLSLALGACSLLASNAQAQGKGPSQSASPLWQSGTGEGSAWAQVEADGLILHLACRPDMVGENVFLSLYGPVPDYAGLNKQDDANSALMV